MKQKNSFFVDFHIWIYSKSILFNERAITTITQSGKQSPKNWIHLPDEFQVGMWEINVISVQLALTKITVDIYIRITVQRRNGREKEYVEVRKKPKPKMFLSIADWDELSLNATRFSGPFVLYFNYFSLAQLYNKVQVSWSWTSWTSVWPLLASAFHIVMSSSCF